MNKLQLTALLVLAMSASAIAQFPDWPAERLPDFLGDGNAPAVADFDGDGRLDIMTLRYSSSTLALLHGDGFGDFVPDPLFPTGILGRCLAAGDFDGDGDADLAFTTSPNPQLFVLSNVGGVLSAPTLIGPVPISNSLTARDVTGDGRADLIVFAYGLASVEVRIASGGGAFGAPIALPSGPDTRAVGIGDATQDGIADVVTTHAGAPNDLRVFAFDGIGAFPLAFQAPLPNPSSQVAIGDVTGDGIADLLVNPLGTTQILLLKGSIGGGFAPAVATAIPVQLSFSLFDVNADGVMDFVGKLIGMTVRFADGSGGFAAPVFSALPPAGSAITLAEVDGRPGVDAVCISMANQFTSGGVLAASGDGAGHFDAPLWTPIASFVSAGIGDVNSDGESDVVGYTPTSVAWFQNDGLGGYAPHVSPVTGFGSTKDMAIGDVNGDGTLDAVVARADLTGTWTLQGDGAGNFSHTSTLAAPRGGPFPAQVQTVGLADFDADGALDLIEGFGPYGLAVASNAGNGTFGPWVVVQGLVYELVLADADADGDLDVFTHGSTFGNLGWYRNDGVGAPVLMGSTVLGVTAGGGTMDVADVTGDGLRDIVIMIMNSIESRVILLEASGPFAFQSPVTQTFPGVIASGFRILDANDDGANDLVVSDTGGMRILEGDQTGAFTPTRSFGSLVTFLNPSIDILDADHNGTDDLVVAGGGVNVWLDGCDGKVGRHGYGCAGSGGFVPALGLSGCPTPGGAVTLSIDHGLGSSVALLLFGANAAQIPIGGTGCSLLVAPLLPVSVTLPLGGTPGPGTGTVSIATALSSTLPPLQVALQALVADPSSPLGFSSTQGITVVVE